MRLFILKKKHLLPICGVLLAIGIVCAVGLTGRDTAQTAAVKREVPIYCVATDDKKVALSFDAAWGNEDTELLIEILGKNNVPATFFVVGEWVDKYPESVKALSDAGHDIMNHSDTHPHMPQLSAEQMKSEINNCNSKIESVTGKCPTLFRMPYGDYNDLVVKTVGEVNMYPIQWDVDSLDWKGLSADEICKRVTSKVKNGSIVLFHNAAENTPAALPGIIETLKNDGYEFVKVSDLIYKDNYSIDNAGVQHMNSSDENISE